MNRQLMIHVSVRGFMFLLNPGELFEGFIEHFIFEAFRCPHIYL